MLAQDEILAEIERWLTFDPIITTIIKAWVKYILFGKSGKKVGGGIFLMLNDHGPFLFYGPPGKPLLNRSTLFYKLFEKGCENVILLILGMTTSEFASKELLSIYPTGQNWNSAKSECISQGKSLLTLKNREKDNMLASLLNGQK